MSELLKHPFLCSMVVIWPSAALASAFVKNSDPMGAALIATIVIGVGFFLSSK